MSTTYIPSNIGSASKDAVRFRVGDVNGQPQWFLQDEEIQARLSSKVFEDGSVMFDEVCALCAENIGAQCVQLATESMQGRWKRIFTDRSKQAFALADRIRNLAVNPPGAPVQVGAISGRADTSLPAAYDDLAGLNPERHGSPFDFPPY